MAHIQIALHSSSSGAVDSWNVYVLPMPTQVRWWRQARCSRKGNQGAHLELTVASVINIPLHDSLSYNDMLIMVSQGRHL